MTPSLEGSLTKTKEITFFQLGNTDPTEHQSIISVFQEKYLKGRSFVTYKFLLVIILFPLI